jgi:hypothetical protein
MPETDRLTKVVGKTPHLTSPSRMDKVAHPNCSGARPLGRQRFGRGFGVVSGVGLPLLGQHGNVLGDAPRPRLGPLGILDLVQDGVPVPAIELGE